MQKHIGKTCPYCQYTIKPDVDITICAGECKMLHHKECWDENCGCTTFGCSESPAISSMSYTPIQPTSSITVDEAVDQQQATVDSSYMIRCSSCDKTFDGNRITGICPYCGAEKGFINEVPQRETDSSNAYSKPKSDVHSSNDRIFPILSILLGLYSFIGSLLIGTFVILISAIGLFLGIKGLKTLHKNLSTIGILICSVSLLFNIIIYIDDYQERTNLYHIAASNFAGVSGVTYHGDRESVAVIIDADIIDHRIDNSLKSMLRQLGFSSAVVSRMYRTRALDGTQRATGDHANATWTYHPDPGLQIVFESNR